MLVLGWNNLGFGKFLNPKKGQVQGVVTRVNYTSTKIYTHYIYYVNGEWYKSREITGIKHLIKGELGINDGNSNFYDGDPILVEYQITQPSESVILNFLELPWELPQWNYLFRRNYEAFIQGKVISYSEIQFISGLFISKTHGLQGKLISQDFGEITSVDDGFQVIKYSYPDSSSSKIKGKINFSYNIDLNQDQDSIWDSKTGEIFIASK